MSNPFYDKEPPAPVRVSNITPEDLFPDKLITKFTLFRWYSYSQHKGLENRHPYTGDEKHWVSVVRLGTVLHGTRKTKNSHMADSFNCSPFYPDKLAYGLTGDREALIDFIRRRFRVSLYNANHLFVIAPDQISLGDVFENDDVLSPSIRLPDLIGSCITITDNVTNESVTLSPIDVNSSNAPLDNMFFLLSMGELSREQVKLIASRFTNFCDRIYEGEAFNQTRSDLAIESVM